MTNVIRVKYVNSNGESVNSYTFYTPYDVVAGDEIVIRMHSNGGAQYGVVTEVDLPIEEALKFGDNIKTILCKVAPL